MRSVIELNKILRKAIASSCEQLLIDGLSKTDNILRHEPFKKRTLVDLGIFRIVIFEFGRPHSLDATQMLLRIILRFLSSDLRSSIESDTELTNTFLSYSTPRAIKNIILKFKSVESMISACSELIITLSLRGKICRCYLRGLCTDFIQNCVQDSFRTRNFKRSISAALCLIEIQENEKDQVTLALLQRLARIFKADTQKVYVGKLICELVIASKTLPKEALHALLHVAQLFSSNKDCGTLAFAAIHKCCNLGDTEIRSYLCNNQYLPLLEQAAKHYRKENNLTTAYYNNICSKHL